MNFVSCQRFFDCRLCNLLAVLISVSRDVILEFSGPPTNLYITRRDFYAFSRVERVVIVGEKEGYRD